MKIVDLKGQNRSLFINNELGNEKKGLSHVIVIGKRDKIYVVAPLIEDKKSQLTFFLDYLFVSVFVKSAIEILYFIYS